MRVLVLVDDAASANERSLEDVRQLQEGNDATVLCLTIMAGLRLRSMGIRYDTPDRFFPSDKWSSIDERAHALSRDWHRVFDSGVMTYRDVSVGEALEYELYHLLVAALRCVEIARVLLEEPFDEIHMPSSDARFNSNAISLHTACYEPLAPIVSYMAKSKGLKVARLPKSSNSLSRRSSRYKPKWDQSFVASRALFLLKNRRDLPSLLMHRKMERVAIFACPICQEGIIRSLRESGTRGVKAFPALLESRSSRSHSDRLLDALRDDSSLSKLDDHMAYTGVRFWRAVYPLVDDVFGRLIPQIFARVDWTEHFARRFRPDVFVVHQDITPLFRSMCQVLKNHGVKIVIIQHGILTNDMAGMFVLPKVGDVQAVWGDYYKRWHTQRGKGEETQVVTGYPRYDRLVDMRSIDCESVADRFGLDIEKKTALVATEWYQPVSSRYTIEHHERYIRTVLKALKAHKDLQIVVKLHPAYQAEYRRIVSEIASQEDVRVTIAEDSLWELVGISSFVIVSLSSVGLEALILGKPVISVNMSDRRDISGLVQDGLAIGAFNEHELEIAISRCVENSASYLAQTSRREELMLPFTYHLDGQAARRTANLLQKISSGRQR
ncbi:MAG: CDP-glycerol glycerophosphotransferase family protein [Methanobacteriota archaeon]|nr:MAG: CDP-glycerol glycerophosphotransferase family protein [Euryarchaeota archaeon]